MAVSLNGGGVGTTFHANPVTATNDSTGLTIAAGTDRALIAQITTSSQLETITGVVWDPAGANQPMTLIGTAEAVGDIGECWLYGLVNPATGNKTLRVSV